MGESIISAVVPSVIGGLFGSDEPSYQQPSMSQIQTPVQQALNDLLIKQAKGSADWAQKFEDDFSRRQNLWKNQQTNYANQTPTTTSNITQIPNKETNTVGQNTFSKNDELERALELQNPSEAVRLNHLKTGVVDWGSVYNDPVYSKMIKNEISPEMIEAYKRQKQLSEDQALLNKLKGVS